MFLHVKADKKFYMPNFQKTNVVFSKPMSAGELNCDKPKYTCAGGGKRHFILLFVRHNLIKPMTTGSGTVERNNLHEILTLGSPSFSKTYALPMMLVAGCSKQQDLKPRSIKQVHKKVECSTKEKPQQQVFSLYMCLSILFDGRAGVMTHYSGSSVASCQW